MFWYVSPAFLGSLEVAQNMQEFECGPTDFLMLVCDGISEGKAARDGRSQAHFVCVFLLTNSISEDTWVWHAAKKESASIQKPKGKGGDIAAKRKNRTRANLTTGDTYTHNKSNWKACCKITKGKVFPFFLLFVCDNKFLHTICSTGSFPNEAVVRLAAEKLKAEGPVDPAQAENALVFWIFLNHFATLLSFIFDHFHFLHFEPPLTANQAFFQDIAGIAPFFECHRTLQIMSWWEPALQCLQCLQAAIAVCHEVRPVLQTGLTD